MKDDVIKWIYENAESIRKAVIALLVINVMIVGFAGCSGNLLYVFTHIPNILFADITFVVPLVYVVKFLKENK